MIIVFGKLSLGADSLKSNIAHRLLYQRGYVRRLTVTEEAFIAVRPGAGGDDGSSNRELQAALRATPDSHHDLSPLGIAVSVVRLLTAQRSSFVQ